MSDQNTFNGSSLHSSEMPHLEPNPLADGDLLFFNGVWYVRDGAILPPRCIKTNAELQPSQSRPRSIYFYPAHLKSLLIFLPFIAPILILLMRKKCRITFGMEPRIWRYYNALKFGSSCMIPISVVVCAYGFVYTLNANVLSLGVAGLVVSLVIFFFHERPLTLLGTYGDYFHVTGLRRPFIKSLKAKVPVSEIPGSKPMASATRPPNRFVGSDPKFRWRINAWFLPIVGLNILFAAGLIFHHNEFLGITCFIIPGVIVYAITLIPPMTKTIPAENVIMFAPARRPEGFPYIKAAMTMILIAGPIFQQRKLTWDDARAIFSLDGLINFVLVAAIASIYFLLSKSFGFAKTTASIYCVCMIALCVMVWLKI